jgi:metal-responsive CopG/Arc/MetJ family transcriptional regulator
MMEAGMKRVRIMVSLSEEVLARLDAECARDERSRSYFVEKGTVRFLDALASGQARETATAMAGGWQVNKAERGTPITEVAGAKK